MVAARQADATPRHPAQGQRQRAVRHRYARARHGLCRREGEPGAMGNVEELQLRRDQGPSRRHRGGAAQGGSRQARPARPAGCRRGRRGHLVPRQDRARAASHRMGLRRQRQGQHGRLLRAGPQADGAEGPRQRQGRPNGGRDHRGLQEGRDRVIRAPVRDPRPHGADQRDRARAGRSRRRLVADARSVGGDHSGCRPARGRSEDRLCPHHVPGRRFRRQRRRRHGRHTPGGRDLQAGRQAREGHLVARGGHRAGQAAPARCRQAHRRHRR